MPMLLVFYLSLFCLCFIPHVYTHTERDNEKRDAKIMKRRRRKDDGARCDDNEKKKKDER